MSSEFAFAVKWALDSGIDEYEIAREFKVTGITVRAWAKGDAVPSAYKQKKLIAWVEKRLK